MADAKLIKLIGRDGNIYVAAVRTEQGKKQSFAEAAKQAALEKTGKYTFTCPECGYNDAITMAEMARHETSGCQWKPKKKGARRHV